MNLNISPRNILRWVKNKNKIISKAKDKDINLRVRKRMAGGGKKPQYQSLENNLSKWVDKLRTEKRIVTVDMIRNRVSKIIKEDDLYLGFKCSYNFIKGFMRRNNLSVRSSTHKAQENLKSPKEKCVEIVKYLNTLNNKTLQYESKYVLNMDETPFYFDMPGAKTINKKGARSVEVLTTGQDKRRFTTVCTLAADGTQLKNYIILKGLKRIPKVDLPSNIILNVNDSGTMNAALMHDYILKVIVPYLAGKKAIVVLDSFKAHFTEDVLETFKNNNIEPLLIPGGYTSLVQPLDISYNKP